MLTTGYHHPPPFKLTNPLDRAPILFPRPIQPSGDVLTYRTELLETPSSTSSLMFSPFILAANCSLNLGNERRSFAEFPLARDVEYDHSVIIPEHPASHVSFSLGSRGALCADTP